MELTLDIFRNDAFSVTSLRRVVNNTPFIPTLIGDMKLFAPKPIATREVLLYEEDSGIRLIPVTEIGAPDVQQVRDVGRLRALATKRLAKQDTVRAPELTGVANMALPETIRLRNAIDLVNTRMSKLRSEMEATKELHRLGALQGKLYDADGTTVIYDYFAEYGVSAAATININFSTTSEADLMMFFQENVRQPMQLILKNRATAGLQIGALCSDYFWGRLMRHDGFRKIYVYQAMAIEVARAANPLVQPNNWERVDFAGITWIHYRGSTNGEMNITANQAVFFPMNAQDVFDVYWAPGETLADATGPGLPEYPYIQPDVRDQMASHIDLFIRSYPLYACIFPQCLLRANATG